MKIFTANDNLIDFMQFVASSKRKLADWQFFHVVISDGETQVNIGEIEQLLEFQVQSDSAWMLKMPSTNEVLLFTPKGETLTLAKIEKAIYENFASDALRARFRGFDSDGLEQFSKIIAPHVKEDDVKAQVVFKRMSRPGNSILIVDDDMMVLKQMEKVMSGIGGVATLQNADKFEETYKEYAPNILFLDIHLGKHKGNELLKALKANVDPFAHVIMISSDTQKEIVMDIKEGGAKGFVVKPFNRNNLFEHVMRAPTFAPRSSV